jgi:hypothetical protein
MDSVGRKLVAEAGPRCALNEPDQRDDDESEGEESRDEEPNRRPRPSHGAMKPRACSAFWPGPDTT